MSKLTLGSIKSQVARATNLCASDAKLIDLINEAQIRLMARGKWVGTWQRYRLCVNDDNCLTWPRQIEAIEAFAICGNPGQIWDMWFEFLENGPGMFDEDSQPGNLLVDRGEGYVTFRDIQHADAAPKRIRVLADVAETSKFIILQGYDENNNWIRTQVSGSWIDGERVSISTTVQVTVNYFSALTGVLKDATNGVVRLFQYNPIDAAQVSIAVYEPDETRPNYRRSYFPGLADMASCCDSNECETKYLTVSATLKAMPVANDNDFLILRSAAAIKLMVLAILYEERNLFNEAAVLEAKAVVELEKELGKYIGDGVVVKIRTQAAALYGGGGVANYL